VVAFYADETRQGSASTGEALLALQKRLPRSVAYGDGNSIVLVDAFGERVTFPWELGCSQDVRLLYYTSSCILTGKNRDSMGR
jgi:hypothetical protein